MSIQNFLNESDVDTLINLLLRSQQSRTREALCFSIGLDPKRLSFLRDSSDYDFFLLLIKYLNETDNQEALCKLCCQQLFPIFSKGTHRLFLSNFCEKLNCNHDLSNLYSNSSKTQNSTLTEVSTNGSIFGRGISIIVTITGVVVLLGGGLMYYFISQSQQLPLGTYQASCPTISVKDSILTGTCKDLHGRLKTSSLEYKQCKYGIENTDGRLECDGM
ncbi:hypothetical protein [Nostoc sp. ChiQUE01b]|uniref:hypothetical protein n=1 Tax=Nostoc sp. ChiQUE01b TaxID=3075376 RepID=UPI002AD5739B|nr:hypothetical protein [Nostoc sp. ChiQUE01b]MDZ8263218.1 hypothetical protein [Nostoc sp. ChiQUE01b]